MPDLIGLHEDSIIVLLPPGFESVVSANREAEIDLKEAVGSVLRQLHRFPLGGNPDIRSTLRSRLRETLTAAPPIALSSIKLNALDTRYLAYFRTALAEDSLTPIAGVALTLCELLSDLDGSHTLSAVELSALIGGLQHLVETFSGEER